MKILFTFGGIPHYLNALLNLMQEKGVEVVVVKPRQGHATIGQGVKMVDGGRFKTIEAIERKMWYGKSGFPQLPEIIQTEQPDIAVMGWPYMLQAAVQPSLKHALQASRCRLMIREIPFQVPPSGHIREYFKKYPMHDENMVLKSQGIKFWLNQWLVARLRKQCYRQAAGALGYCSHAHDIMPSYGIEPGKVFVTYNSTNTPALLAERDKVKQGKPLFEPSAKRILHIGRLVKWKRVDLLLEAMNIVLRQEPEAELLIVGKGPEENNLKAQAKHLGIASRVAFAGAIYDPHTLGACMNESTIYVLAGMGGLSINDAMTYGMPIICSQCDGSERDLVQEGVNGLFFKEGDANDLAEKIMTIFNSPELGKSMGEASHRRIVEEINLNTVCDRYIAAFHAVLGSTPDNKCKNMIN